MKPETKVEIDELIARYEELRKRKDELAEETKLNNQEYEEIQVELAKAITDADQDSVTSGGFAYSPQVTTDYSFRSEEALKAAGIDKIKVFKDSPFADLVKEYINPRSLSKPMREAAESEYGIPDDVMECLNTHDRITISRQKKGQSKRNKLKNAFERMENDV